MVRPNGEHRVVPEVLTSPTKFLLRQILESDDIVFVRNLVHLRVREQLFGSSSDLGKSWSSAYRTVEVFVAEATQFPTACMVWANTSRVAIFVIIGTGVRIEGTGEWREYYDEKMRNGGRGL